MLLSFWFFKKESWREGGGARAAVALFFSGIVLFLQMICHCFVSLLRLSFRMASGASGRFGAGLSSGDGADSEKDFVGRYGLSFCWGRFY